MHELKFTTKFKKDVSRCKRRNYNFKKFETVIKYLEESGEVPEDFLPHPLKGEYADNMECHIKPDWILIWRVDESKDGATNDEGEEYEGAITLVRTGTHADLFK